MLLLTNLADDGRPFYNDDLDLLQTEMLSAATATFSALGSFIVSGCLRTPGVEPDTYNISPGLVWLDRLRQFPGAEGVAGAGWIGAGATVTSGPRLFETGVSKNAYVEHRASWDTVATAGAIAFTVDNPGLRYWQLVAAQGRALGLLEQRTKKTAADYDETGLGRGAARGWAVANGENGTEDLRGRFTRTENTGGAAGVSATLLGDTGGEEEVTLTVAQIPAHNHTNGAFTKLLKASTGNDSNNDETDFSSGEPNVKTMADMQPAGGGQAHNNMPPHYTVFLVEWIGL